MRNDAEYMSQWRKTPSGQAAARKQARRQKAKDKAVRILIERYSVEYQKLFDLAMTELAKTEGLV